MVLRLLFAAVLLVVIEQPSVHAVEPAERLTDPALEARARGLSKELRCLVCQNQSIDESNADLADRSGLARLTLRAAWRRLRHLPRGTWGYALAHFGVGVLIAGIVVSTAWRSERIESMHAGDTLEIAGRTLRFVGVTEGDVANYHVERAHILVERPGAAAMALYPERRWYPVARSQTTNTAIATNGLGDLYLALGDPDGQGGWVLRAYYNPLVPWIWFGAVLAALGGLVSLSDRRQRMRLAAARAPIAVTARPADS